MIPFIEDSRTCKLTYSDKKQISGCLENGWVWRGCRERYEDGVTNGHEETFGPNTPIHYLNCSDGLAGLHICQSLRNCTLQICAVY